MKNSKIKNIISVIGKVLYYIIITFICIIALFLLYYIVSSQINANNEDYKPKISIYTIVSPSMTPTIKVYDVVVNVREDKPENIKVGDIITYTSKASTSEGMTITHRVVEVNKLPDGEYEYRTQGDNNSEPDSLYVSYDQVIGKEFVIIPYLGRIQFLIANQKGWLFLLLIPVSIYMLIELYKLFNLFGIKKKVKEVVNVPNSEEEQRELEEARKEKIREELQNRKEVPLPTTRKEIEDYKKETVEVLDTDLLTSKIKEYDDRIDQLDEVLKHMSDDKTISMKSDDNLVEEDNYLKGEHIKVTKTEEAKKKRKTAKDKKVDNQIIDLEFEETQGDKNIDFEDIVPVENRREKIERPESVDIKEISDKEVKPTKGTNKTLNLNPKNVKKVNRTGRSNSRSSNNRNNNVRNTRTNNTRNSNSRSRSRNLNLNPNNVKKVNRNKPKPKPKKKLIVIEKTK